jgi:hypothetical protein
MGVDEQLLDLNIEAEEKAGDLQAAKREFPLGATPKESGDLSFSEQVRLSRQEESRVAKEKEGKSSGISPVRIATDNLLKGAWTNLITSWGLTLLYIDLHFFLNKVVGEKFFGPLGKEWIPVKIKRAGGAQADKVGGLIKISETMGCALLNLLALAVVVGLLALASLIASAIADPLKAILNWLSDSIPGFTALFK